MDDRVRRVAVGEPERRIAVGDVELVPAGRDELGALLREHRAEVRADEAAPAREQDLHADATSTSATATGRCSRSERQAARPMTSGARASAGPTGVAPPAASAPANAAHSRR